MPTYYSIDETAARRAKEMNSHFGYKPGSATASYRQEVDKAATIAEAQKTRVDPMYHEKIDRLLDTYARRLAENLNQSYAIAIRCPSVLVAGPANFPVRKKEKQNRADEANLQEWRDIQGILARIRGTGMAGISSDDENALQKLREKLDRREREQEVMKSVNAYYRKHGTVPFPIPDQEYDAMMDLLSGLEIGDALERDCQVNEQDSWYGVLDILEGTTVNVDELDYLAKRLDSFCDDEAEQFQAMAHKLGLTCLRDFINLTFCCERATVISDFSKLEEAGRNYRMSLNGGSMPMDELKALDGRKEALQLITAGGGTVTPYGVVYDNGMELEQLYDGRHFPAYFYDAYPLALAITSKREPGGKPEYLFLPASEQKIQRTLLRAGVREDTDLQLRLECNELPEQISFAVDLEHLERADLSEWNRMCRAVKALSASEQKKLEAAVMMTMPHGPDEVCRLAENLSQFDFVPDIKTPEEYGRYMIRESGHFEYDENLEGFYDFLGYGLQKVEKEQGRFNDLGYIAYHGALTLDELLREDPAEQYQREQGPKMGGPL